MWIQMQSEMKEATEIWKDILGYKDLYQGSNIGRIRSLKFGKVRILKPFKTKKNYLQVALFKGEKKKQLFVHRLVYEAFNGEIPEGMEINHIDENPLNNRLDNLNLMTHIDNMNYGTRNQKAKEKLTNGKLSKRVYQYTIDGVLVKIWSSTQECGRNGFSQGDVAECCRGERKQYKGFIWSYTKL